MVNQFLSGAVFTAGLIAALLFLRSWQRTRDRLFILFTLAFTTLAMERVILLVVSPGNEFAPYIYTVRLFAFLIIIVAIIDKNRR